MIVSCKTCSARVDGEPLAEIKRWVGDELPYRYSFLKCPVCSGPLLVVQEDFGQGWDEPYRVYPPPDRKADSRLPEELRRSFQEALDCLNAGTYQACVLMCRKSLEGLCQLKGAGSAQLGVALKKLHDSGVIDDRLFEWAEALREDGNLAAHNLEARFGKNAAEHVVDFTEAILEYVFVLADKFDEFKDFRAKRSSKKKPKVATASAAQVRQ